MEFTLEINNRKITEKSPNTWEVNHTLHQWVKKEVSRKINISNRMKIKLQHIKNCGTWQQMKGKFIAPNL
uniref:Macaca fascicularis brain cDNA, clone: QflA-16044 n=1 Tax=Macaca fascicularis TaxID=9541 RepID=I7GB80_MACFA|nr:unnamed protein product [Macaca fascicularis]